MLQPQFTKPVSLTQLTLPSVPRGYYIHLCSKSTNGPQVPTQATSIGPLGLGADSVHVLLLSKLEVLPVCCLPPADFKAQPAFPLILGKLSWEEMPFQPLFIVGAFWFTRLLSCEPSGDLLTPITYTDK